MTEEEKKNSDYGAFERRGYSLGAEPQLRDATSQESRTIVGYAIVFGSRSEVLSSWGERFEEVIHPEAVTPELLQRCDIKALMEHNHERLLARSNKGQGTLSLTIDHVGLRYEFDAPKTVDGDTALELVRRGDIAGSSFAFRAYSEGAVERSWDDKRKMWIYDVRKIDAIYDVTLTSNPAYSETSVSARSLDKPEPAEELVQLEAYRQRIKEL